MNEVLQSWLIRLLLFFGAVLLSALIHLVSRKAFKRVADNENKLQNQRSLSYMSWGISFLLFAAVAYYWLRDFSMAPDLFAFLDKLIHSLALLGLSFFFYGLLPKLFVLGRKSSLSLGLNETKTASLRRIGEAGLRLLVILLGLSAILTVWGFNISGMLTGLGIGSLAVALAAQNLLSNLIGGASLMLDKPFAIGDTVIIGDLSGSIEEVGWRSTRMRSFNDELVTMPNAKVMDSNIVNVSRMGRRRVNLTLEVGGTDAEDKIADFRERLLQFIQARQLVQEDPKPLIMIQNLRWGGYHLLVRYYISDTDYSLYLAEVDAFFLESTRIMKEMGLTQVYAEKSSGELSS